MPSMIVALTPGSSADANPITDTFVSAAAGPTIAISVVSRLPICCGTPLASAVGSLN